MAMFNSYFYRQNLNKINKYKLQNLELGIITHIFHKFWCTYVLQVTNMKYMTKYAIREGSKRIQAKESPKAQTTNIGAIQA